MADIENLSQRLASEFARGEADINRPADVPAIPTPGEDLLSLKKTVAAIKQLLDAREARSGSVLDKAVTLRELINAGGINVNLPGFVVNTAGSIISGGSGAPGPAGPPGPPGLPGGGFQDPRPILSSAPTPTNLVVRGTFRTVILDWDLVDYQNHAYCEIWRHTTNAIGSAINIGDTPSRTGPYTDSTAVNGVNYFYWVRAVAIDTAGNLLVGAFNAVNGTQGGPGRIGGVDLNDLIITADKLADGQIPMIKFAAGIRPPRVVDTLPVAPFTGYSAGDMVVLTTDNKLYRFTGSAFTRAVDGADLIANSITAGSIAAGAIGASQIAAGAIAVGSAAIANGAIRRALIEDLAVDSAKIDNLSVTTGKIADLAVTGAKIQDATIIDAKIVNLNAGKINAGFISADRIAAGTIDATKINSNGLSIRDTAGNVILQAGVSLAASTLNIPGTVTNVPSGWQNANITISGGAIQGIGTGSGTLIANNSIVLDGNNGTITLTGGPGGSVTGVIMPGNPVTAGNIGTYIASAAISDAYIANLNAAKINAGVIDAARIGANTIDASKIAANSINARHLTLTDLENLVTNGRGASLDGWSANPSTQIGVNTNFIFWPSSYGSRLSIDCWARDHYFGQPIPVRAGDSFFLSWDSLPFGGADMNFLSRFGLHLINSAGATIDFATGIAERPAVTSGAARISGVYVVPPTHSGQVVAAVQPWVQIEKPFANTSNAAKDGIHVTNVILRRRNGGELIVDGAISTDKLSVGARGLPSLVPNADFTDFTGTDSGIAALRTYQLWSPPPVGGAVGRNFSKGTGWNIGRGGAFFTDTFVAVGVTTNSWGIISDPITVSGNTPYEFHAKGSVHRCTHRAYIEWFSDAAATVNVGTVLAWEVAAGTGIVGSATSMLPHGWLQATSPPTAIRARVLFLKSPGQVPASDSYVFLHEVYLNVLQSGASAASPTRFRGPDVVEIHGGGIQAQTVTATQISIKGTATTGRIEIETNRIRVFDNSGVERVRIGSLL